MHIAGKSPKHVNRTHASPTHYLVSPQRHSVEIQRLNSPQDLHQYVHKRSTHKLESQHRQHQGHHYQYAKAKFDNNLGESEDEYAEIIPRKERHFLTKEPTPRVTAGKKEAQGRFRSGDREYLIIKKKDNRRQNPVDYSDQQQDQLYDDKDHSNRVQKISILSKSYVMPKSNKQLNLQHQVQKRQNIPSLPIGKSKHSNYQGTQPSNVNHVQRQSHNHKRSDCGPQPQPKLFAHNQHRRLATTAEQYDEECENTPAEEEQELEDFNHPSQQHEYYLQPQEQLQEEQVNNYQNYGQPNPFLRKKENGQQLIQRQIEARFRDIEQILETENGNLKEQNQYLLAVIKKLQAKDRKQKNQIHLQQMQIEKLSQERNAYLERCFHLQNLSAMGNRAFQEGGYQHIYGSLNYNQDHGLRGHQREHIHVDEEEEKEKINGLRQHLQNTIGKEKSRQTKHMAHQQASPPKQAHHEITNSSLAYPTPQFISTGESPQRRARLTAKKSINSNNSNNSDPSSTILHEQSGIMNTSNSFGAGWARTNSGYSVVNGLQNYIKTEEEKDNISDIFEDEQTEIDKQQNQGRGDHAKTMKNSHSNSRGIKYASRADEAAVEELNRKFEQLMKQYRVNHDLSIRKQCVHVAKQIKQLKQEIERNREQDQGGQDQKESHQRSRVANRAVGSDGFAEQDQIRPRNEHTRVYNTNGQQILTRVRSS